MKYAIILLLLANKLICQVLVAPSSNILCRNNSSIVNFTIASGTPPYTYTVGTPTCSTNYTTVNASANPSFTLPCAGVYTFTVKDAASTLIGSVTHTVITNTSLIIPVEFGASGGDTICNGISEIIFVTDTPSVFSLTNILWSDSETGQVATVSPTTTTTYSVNALYTLTSSSKTCAASGSKKIVVNQCANGIEEYNILNFAHIYPSPMQDFLYIDFIRSEIKNMNLSITNNLGQVVFINDNLKDKNDIDLSFLANGIYYVTLKGNSQPKTFKVIKE